jgi:hypothetical protein
LAEAGGYVWQAKPLPEPFFKCLSRLAGSLSRSSALSSLIGSMLTGTPDASRNFIGLARSGKSSKFSAWLGLEMPLGTRFYQESAKTKNENSPVELLGILGLIAACLV